MSGTGLITAPIGNAALAPAGENAPTATYPSSVWDYTPFLEDSTRLARALGNAQAQLGTVDDYGRQLSPPEPSIPAADANQKYGIPGHLTFPADLPESVAADKYQAKRDELMRADAAARSDAGLFTKLGAGFAAGIVDPLNLAASFVPGVSEARVAGTLARVGIDGLAGRTLARIGTGAINAELGQVPLTGLRYGLARDEGEDYSMANAAADILMGGAIGAGGHLFVGAAKDLVGSAFGRSAIARLAADDPTANEQLARAAIAQQLQGEPVNLAPVLDSTALRSAYADRLQARGAATAGTYNAFTPAGARVELRPDVMEAGDLVPSNLHTGEINPAYPAELQPRDRTNAASQAQVQEIASKLEPELLGPSPLASAGAPIVNADNVVESGNGRVMALTRAYRDPTFTNQAAAYRAFLEAQGHDVAGMKEPILVGRRITDLSPQDLEAFTKQANERATLGMSAAEQARADVGRVAKAIDSYEPGPLAGAGNRDFMARVMAQIPAEERGGMMLADGRLSIAGETRIRAALMAHAYGDALGPTLERMLDGNTEGMKGPANALADAAGKWSQLRAAAARGEIPAGLDITPAIGEAMQLLDRAHKTGVPLTELLAQRDMLHGEASSAAQGLLHLMFRDEAMRQPVARAKIADLLSRYVDQALEAKPGPGLFGEAETSPADILRAILTGDDRGEAAARGLEMAPAEAMPERAGRPDSDTPTPEQIGTGETIRFYHGGTEYDGGPRWLTEDRRYAEGYAEKNANGDAFVHYVDLPADHPALRGLAKTFDDTGSDQRAPYVHWEAPEEIASQLRPLEKDRATDGEAPETTRPEAAPGQAPPELTEQIANLQSELRELAASGAGDPSMADELARIAAADAEQQSVAGAIGQAAACLLGGL